MRHTQILISALSLLILSSCSTKKTQLPYFIDLQEQKEGVLEQMTYSAEIAPDDELLINISSSTPEATAQYNMPMINTTQATEVSATVQFKYSTYIVDSKGDITMPILGTIHVAGMTAEQLQEKLTEMIRKDISDAIVQVRILNFTVVVAGEVLKPGVVPVTGNRFSILDALGAAGDLTPYGERSRVLVIREENGQRLYNYLDLNSSEMLNSPYFYLKQNDYIYVEPNKVRQANAKYNQDNAFKLSVISTVVSATSVIASLIIALAVK